jgi:hypothetical protein
MTGCNGFEIRQDEEGMFLVIDPLSVHFGTGDGVCARFPTIEEAKAYCLERDSPNE